NFVSDPVSFLRGTYSSAGTFTSGTVGRWEATDTTIYLGASRATGTGLSGSGNPTYVWHRSPNSGFTPSGATALTDGNGVSGSTTLFLTDASVSSETSYFYRIRSSDGSSNVNSSQVTAILYRRPAIRIGSIGDSTMTGTGIIEAVTQVGLMRGRRLSFLNS